MKKIFTLIFISTFMFSLTSCQKENAVLDNAEVYEITSNIHSLDIQINAADFIIKHVEEFSVESNLKHLSVSEKNGVLTIIDKAKSTSTYVDAMLTVCIPNNMEFENVKLAIGTAKLTVDTLSANSLKLELGAGDVKFKNLNASSTVNIKGGAGQITIVNSTLNNLTLEMGVGELNLTAALLGNSDLKFGVGESNLTLIGSKDDYNVAIEKGLGNISIDGKNISNFSSSGNGQNHVEITGGVGAVNLNFEEK